MNTCSMYIKVYRLGKAFREILLISSDSGVVAVFVLESTEILGISLTVIKVFIDSGVVTVSALESTEISGMSWTMITVSVVCSNKVH